MKEYRWVRDKTTKNAGESEIETNQLKRSQR